MNIFMFLALLEGCIAGFYELMGANITAMYFGNSLKIWAFSVFISLLGLSIGYYSGMKLAEKLKNKLLIFILFISLIFISLWGSYYQATSRWLFSSISEIDLFWGLIICLCLSILPIMVICGAISPILVVLSTQKSKQVNNESNYTSKVFLFSNIGGLLISLVIFSWLIDLIAIKRSFFILNALIFIALLSFWKIESFNKKLLFIIVLPFLANFLFFKGYNRISSNIEIPYISEGIKGQIKIMDDTKKQTRTLLVNHSPQSFIHFSGRSLWPYVYQLSTYASAKPSGAKVLLAGLGGGSLIYEMSLLGYHTDVVDIDKRMYEVTKNFFVWPDTSSFSFINNDFRGYVNTTDKKYDIIIIDLSQAETMPPHIYTMESFSKIKSILNPGGILLTHLVCNREDNDSEIALHSVFKTLSTAGFNVKLMNTRPVKNNSSGYIFSSTLDANSQLSANSLFRIDSLIPANLNIPVKGDSIFIPFDFSKESLVLTDDQLQLEKLQQKSSDKMRKQIIKNTIAPLLDNGFQLYN